MIVQLVKRLQHVQLVKRLQHVTVTVTVMCSLVGVEEVVARARVGVRVDDGINDGKPS